MSKSNYTGKDFVIQQKKTISVGILSVMSSGKDMHSQLPQMITLQPPKRCCRG